MDTSLFLQSLYSDGSKYFVSNPFPKKGEKITIAVQMLQNPEIKAVFFHGKFNGVDFPQAMKLVSAENGLGRFEIEVQIFEKELNYNFIIATKNQIYYYNEAGVYTYAPDDSRNFRILTDFVQPEWVKSTVFYQIFPERFCNGKPEISVKEGEYTFDGYKSHAVKDWNSVPEPYEKAHCLDFFGGDLYGIIEKIPYFKKLGVNALYLNPIFYAATVHKYDCLDYFHVDPHFGGDEALAELTRKLHENGMKIILDVSINHTGTANRWFNKEGVFFPKSEGAYNNPESEEREYYFFGKDNEYKSWFDVSTLPTLNYTSQKLRNRLYRDADSLVKKWLKAPYSTDGWRFDVADIMARNNEIQLHHEVWPEIHDSIKEENPQAYILAEEWTDSSEFLNGNEWDSQMNYYGSSRPIRQFLGQKDIHAQRNPDLNSIDCKFTAKDFTSQLMNFWTKIPFAVRQLQFNLLDSHDVPRFHNDKEMSRAKVRSAVLAIFTLPGCTNMYYGDEAEIDGKIDSMEGCRYPMCWNKDIESTESWKLYSALCGLKTGDKAFSDGGFKILSDEGQTLAFARFTPDELFVTIISGDAEESEVKLPLCIFGKKFAGTKPETDWFGNKVNAELKDGILTVKVPAEGSYLLKF